MQVELTNFCNLRCPVCPVGTKDLTRPPLAMEVGRFERLMAEVGPYLLVLALWAWGEPLLHPQLERILQIARQYPTATLLSTNGQNLDDERVQQALTRQPPTYLIVAIDGLCDETNARFRRGARLQPALDGVRRLAAWKAATGSPYPVLHCRFMVMEHNEHELPGLRDFAVAAGFDMVSIRSLSIIDSDEHAHRSFVPKATEWKAYAYAGEQRVRRSDFVCQHAWTFPTMLADGTLVACDQDFNGSQPYGVFGNDVSFRSLWFGETAARIRKRIRDTPQDFTFCRNCPYADRPISTCSIGGYSLRSPTCPESPAAPAA
jgi:MoaA/NifB/PqqE/SkfB family radical SAM enzyme